jgi:hypothetical protein
MDEIGVDHSGGVKPAGVSSLAVSRVIIHSGCVGDRTMHQAFPNGDSDDRRGKLDTDLRNPCSLVASRGGMSGADEKTL